MKWWRMAIGALMFSVAGCASLYPSEPEVKGTYDREIVRRHVRDHLVPIRHCYERELKLKPKLSGKAVAEWDISASGAVERVSILRSVDPVVDQCLSDELKKIKYPPPPEHSVVTVRFPFAFSALPTAEGK